MRGSQFLLLTLALFGVLIVAAFLSGEPVFAVPVAIVGVIVLAFFLINRMLSARQMEKHGGDPERAVSDSDDPLPSSHVITDDDTALGDTQEAHDEINPHDMPPGHPARRTAEEQAAARGGTTRGSEELLDVGPDRDESGDRSGGKSEQPTRSADRAK